MFMERERNAEPAPLVNAAGTPAYISIWKVRGRTGLVCPTLFHPNESCTVFTFPVITNVTATTVNGRKRKKNPNPLSPRVAAVEGGSMDALRIENRGEICDHMEVM